MTSVKKWTVDLYLDEHSDERRTYAEARLHSDAQTQLIGIGAAHRNPRDPEVPEVGDEVAAARALADLAEKLRLAAASDIDEFVEERASHGW